MDERYLVQDIVQAMADRSHPSVVTWNRLEGRPRTTDFTRALRAEVRDALWMLTRQWQVGEFRGDDAGSPVLARIHVETEALTHYRARDGVVEAVDNNLPLEATVERRRLPLMAGTQAISLDVRLLLGRQWLKMLNASAGDLVGDYRQAFRVRYGIAYPNPATSADALVCAHAEVWQMTAAVAGKSMDGGALYLFLTASTNARASQGFVLADPADAAVLDSLGEAFVAWAGRVFTQSAEEHAWDPSRLEYRFSCGTDAHQFSADDYHDGHLDWYSVDAVVPSPGTATTPVKTTYALLPTGASFDGMPNTRWWAFEDARTNFGDLRPDTTDIAKLLLMEFALVSANDWFVVPMQLPVGSFTRVRGVAVTNVFGERFWIEAARSAASEQWQRWGLFAHSRGGDPLSTTPAAAAGLLLLQTVVGGQQGTPLEDVRLVRDEVANMVWGIESVVPLATGGSKPGAEAAAELRAFLVSSGSAATAAEPAFAASARYRAMTSVPEHWIPFIPARTSSSVREVQLQRAAMLRTIEGRTGSLGKVRPRTNLLATGLDQAPQQPYFVYEEEVPRAGARVTQAFQRARTASGRVVVWLGARKGTGRGEGSSGLSFDQLVNQDA